MGASEETIAQARAMLKLDEGPPRVAVLPECWFAVRVFEAMGTQWHYETTPNGARRAGLRLEVLPIVLSSLRHEPHRRPLPDVLPQLRVMESAALEVFRGK